MTASEAARRAERGRAVTAAVADIRAIERQQMSACGGHTKRRHFKRVPENS